MLEGQIFFNESLYSMKNITVHCWAFREKMASLFYRNRTKKHNLLIFSDWFWTLLDVV